MKHETDSGLYISLVSIEVVRYRSAQRRWHSAGCWVKTWIDPWLIKEDSDSLCVAVREAGGIAVCYNVSGLFRSFLNFEFIQLYLWLNDSIFFVTSTVWVYCNVDNKCFNVIKCFNLWSIQRNTMVTVVNCWYIYSYISLVSWNMTFLSQEHGILHKKKKTLQLYVFFPRFSFSLE